MPTTRTQPHRKDAPPQEPTPPNPERQPIDDEFDALLQSDDSKVLLELMWQDALKAYHRGETEEGGFG
ncbi:MAG: hypothetical protein DYG96_10895 [Chlorobi bacterium CHB2]|nr:hypothetical protein [Chlorobi bacterium CHB2]